MSSATRKSIRGILLALAFFLVSPEGHAMLSGVPYERLARTLGGLAAAITYVVTAGKAQAAEAMGQ